MRPIKQLVSSAVNAKLKKEFTTQKVERLNERPVEYAFALKMLSKYYPKKLLDVGTGTTAFPHLLRNCGMHVTAIDNVKDYWPKGMFNRHYYVLDEDILEPTLKNTYEMIFCISTLEHIENAELAVENMSKLLDKKGFIVLTFPSSPKGYVRNCYELEDSSYGKNNPYIAQSFSPNDIQQWCRSFNLEVVQSECWKFWTGEYWTCGDQLLPPKLVQEDEAYQLRCLCLRFSRR